MIHINSTAFIQSPSHLYQYPGEYTVGLTITSKNGCRTFYSYQDLITAYPLPGSEFISDKVTANVIDGTIYFTNLTKITNCKSYWSFGDGDSSNLRNPVHRYNIVGEFSVRLISVSTEGCIDSARKDISIIDQYTFYAPTAFSPDNDEINDVFCIFGHGIDPDSFTMIIYDRWGEKIFETHSYDENNPSKYGWDGKVKDKKIATPGTYAWLVIYKDFQKIEHQKAGMVTLIK